MGGGEHAHQSLKRRARGWEYSRRCMPSPKIRSPRPDPPRGHQAAFSSLSGGSGAIIRDGEPIGECTSCASSIGVGLYGGGGAPTGLPVGWVACSGTAPPRIGGSGAAADSGAPTGRLSAAASNRFATAPWPSPSPLPAERSLAGAQPPALLLRHLHGRSCVRPLPRGADRHARGGADARLPAQVARIRQERLGER